MQEPSTQTWRGGGGIVEYLKRLGRHWQQIRENMYNLLLRKKINACKATTLEEKIQPKKSRKGKALQILNLSTV
jgi:hypothetical protein